MPISTELLQASQEYWNTAAKSYAKQFTGTLIGRMWRDVVWRELDVGFEPGYRVLEINCGTGVDAIHLAHRGVSVLACDISSCMIELAQEQAIAEKVQSLVDFRVLPTEHLGMLAPDTIFDGAFSNFSGLNCVQDIAEVRRCLATLLRPGAPVFLCMLGRLAPSGKLWRLIHADWISALRRREPKRTAKKPTPFKVQYPSPKQIEELFAPEFTLRRWKGIGIAVPPAFMDRWAVHFPGLTRGLDRVDRAIGDLPFFRNLGGCILFEFTRKTKREQIG